LRSKKRGRKSIHRRKKSMHKKRKWINPMSESICNGQSQWHE
jgi:hypothetical protein